jgi:hypothetical protein
MNKHERSRREIEQEIAATRDRMSRDIDELGERLTPANLKRRARKAVKKAARKSRRDQGPSPA